MKDAADEDMTLFFNLLALQQVLQVKLLHMTVLLINMHNLCFCTDRKEKEEVCCFSHSGKSCLICVNRVIEVNIYLITNLKIVCRQKDSTVHVHILILPTYRSLHVQVRRFFSFFVVVS